MKITVVIPVYNAEKYIESAVKSALKQKEVNEVILIEDYSQDESLKKCQFLKTKYDKVKLFRNDDNRNLGAASSRNLGIIKATNNWIAFLDADDVYLDNRFRHIFDKLKKNKDADGIYDAIGVFFENEDLKKSWKGGNLTTVKEEINPEELFYNLLFGGKGYFHLDGLTVKKELLIKVGMFDRRLRLHQDTHLSAKMATTGKLFSGIIDKPVALRRVHGNNRIMGPSSKFLYSRIRIYKYLLEWINLQKNVTKKVLKKNLISYKYFNAYKNICMYEKRFYKYFCWGLEFVFRYIIKFIVKIIGKKL